MGLTQTEKIGLANRGGIAFYGGYPRKPPKGYSAEERKAWLKGYDQSKRAVEKETKKRWR